MNDDNKKKKIDIGKTTKKKVTRRIVINLSSSFSQNNFVNYLIKLLINVSLFIVIIEYSGVAKYSTIYDIVIFAMWFSIFENIFMKMFATKFSKYLVMSFGTILIFPIVLSMVLGYLSVQGYLQFVTTEMFLGFIIVFMFMRKVLTTLLISFIQRRRFNKMMKEKGGF